jgi:hypothetical protein
LWRAGNGNLGSSRAGLAKLKSFRASGTDLDDIERLKETE